MNERLVCIRIPYVYPGASSNLGDNFAYMTIPYDLTIVSVEVAPSANETDGTVDINDDGSGVITAVSCAVKATPGTWKAVGYGGTNTAVRVAAGSVLSFDANSFENEIGVIGTIWGFASDVVS